MEQTTEQQLTDFIVTNRQIIDSSIPALRSWMLQQSEIDIDDATLNSDQRAMATRVFMRASHTGTADQQATELELDAYLREAHILREVIPSDILNFYSAIEVAASNLAIARETLEIQRQAS
ncbi:MAG: hypothetical protein ACI8WM_000539 [Burkholderiaceae bacterium]|jgi:hypothetical protein